MGVVGDHRACSNSQLFGTDIVSIAALTGFQMDSPRIKVWRRCECNFRRSRCQDVQGLATGRNGNGSAQISRCSQNLYCPNVKVPMVCPGTQGDTLDETGYVDRRDVSTDPASMGTVR